MTANARPTRIAAAAIAAHLRVALDTSGHLAVADASTKGEGVVEYAVASGDPVAMTPLNEGGTLEMVASEAIGDGVTAYAAAGGKIASTGTVIVGITYAVATADGDIIEVMPT